MGQLKDRLREDMKAAMKARDTETLSVIRMALTAIQNAEVAGDEARGLTDSEEQKILGKEVSSRKDSAEAYSAGNRQELADKELAEVEVLQRYLPEQLSDEDLDGLVTMEVAQAGAGGEPVTMKQMGQIIKAVNARVDGAADGKRIAAAVKAALQQG